MSQEQNEAKIPLDEIIKKLADQIEKLTKIIEKSTKSISDNTDTNKDWHKFQAMMKIELEKEHGRQVRLNKEYARSSQSLEMFTGLLSRGASVGLVFKSLTGSITGVSKELDKYKAEHAELMRMEKEFAKKGIDVGRGDLEKAGNEMEREQHRRQQEAVGKAEEGKQGKEGKLAEGISSMKAFADKHKTGILIGAGSVGILLTVLKKAFDVSPMFQAIKKLLQFGFMLILRPIGDFFGFIMRPIMVMMLRKFIIPWYKDVYPIMKKWGTWIGNQVVKPIERTFTAGTPENTAAIVAAATIPAAVILKKLAPKILPTAAAAGGGAATDIAANKKRIIKLPSIKLPAAVTKTFASIAKIPTIIKAGTVSAITKSVDKIKNIAAPIVKTLTSPKLVSAAADVAKFAPKILKVASRAIPIVGGALLGIDAAGSALKQFAPEQYEGIRQGGLALGAMLGDTEGHATEGVMDFFGFGKKSTAEQIAGAVGYGANKLGIGEQFGTSGVGGGAGIARGGAGAGVTIFIDHVSNEADIQRMGNVMQERIQESNKRTVKSY